MVSFSEVSSAERGDDLSGTEETVVFDLTLGPKTSSLVPSITLTGTLSFPIVRVYEPSSGREKETFLPFLLISFVLSSEMRSDEFLKS